MASLCRYFLSAVFLWTGVLSARAQTDSLRYQIKVSKYLMGTIVDATLVHSDVEEGRADLVRAFQEMERVEALLSMHRETSEISLVNRNAGMLPVKVHPETFAILSRAKSYAVRLDGLFDVTVGAVTTLWGFSDDQEPHLPPDSAITRARKLVDFRKLILSERDTTAFLSEVGMKIDLGGIAKGYAIDSGASVLHSLGRTDFLIKCGWRPVRLRVKKDLIPRGEWVFVIPETIRRCSRHSMPVIWRSSRVATMNGRLRRMVSGITTSSILAPATRLPAVRASQL